MAARIVNLLLFPFRFFFAFLGFLLTSWSASRPVPAFIKGLFAVAIAGGFLAAIIGGQFLQNTKIVNQYQNRFAYELTTNDDPKMASNFAHKLMDLYPDDFQHHYRLGTALYEDGDKRGAFDVMKFVANSEQTEANAPARVWIARTLENERELDFISAEDRIQNIEKNYRAALENISKNEDIGSYLEAKIGLAKIHREEGLAAEDPAVRDEKLKLAISEFKEAIAETDITADIQLQYLPMYVDLYRETEQVAVARGLLKQVFRNIMPYARRFPDSPQLWRILIESAARVNDFDEAEDIVTQAMQLATQQTTRMSIMRMRGQVLLAKAEYFKNPRTFKDFKLRLEAVGLATIANIMAEPAYIELLNYVVPEEEDPNLEKWLHRSIVGSQTASITHIILGLREMNEGNIAEGQKHWKVADRQVANAQLIINNLIETAYRRAPDRIESVEDIISVAIENFPEQYYLYVTQGKIYLDQGEYERAIKELEYARKQLPKVLRLHEALVEAYTKNGEPEKAEASQEEVEQIRRELKKFRERGLTQ